jgi:large subunit ribosomal protein L22
MEAVAKLRNCPLSPRKTRLVADIIRGQDVDHALNLLKFTKKHAAKWIEKNLLSAIANWEVKSEANADEHDLYIKEIRVDEGTMLKRFRPAPHGRAHRIRKRSNHITIIVANRIPLDMDSTAEQTDEDFEDADSGNDRVVEQANA